ncbi:MAG: hypothetical protein U9O87_07270 [Verrucomicrobiota bacterium]|nr:hypothetical protein [Verrucomicrobiota bacterium]
MDVVEEEPVEGVDIVEEEPVEEIQEVELEEEMAEEVPTLTSAPESIAGFAELARKIAEEKEDDDKLFEDIDEIEGGLLEEDALLEEKEFLEEVPEDLEQISDGEDFLDEGEDKEEGRKEQIELMNTEELKESIKNDQ